MLERGPKHGLLLCKDIVAGATAPAAWALAVRTNVVTMANATTTTGPDHGP